MDFSDKYILMCKKAEEIQANWKTKAFDIYLDKAEIIRVVAEDYGCEFKSEGISKYGWENEMLWLPHQDQLQEMVKNKFGTVSNLCFSFYTFLGMRHQGNVYKFSSLEQLWIAFVMSEKYFKQWSEEKLDWINIEKGENK